MATVAIVVSSKGFHWEELAVAFREFDESGIDTRFFTPIGEQARPDPLSVRVTRMLCYIGWGVSEEMAPHSRFGRELETCLTGTLPVSRLNTDEVDAIYIPGGHGCLFDVNHNPGVHVVIRELYAKNKILSAVCHATSTFAYVEANGDSIVKGKRVTGFPELLDRFLVLIGGVHPAYLPLPFSNERVLRKAGARNEWWDILQAILDPAYMCVDWPFITGVGPKAARKVARTVVKHIKGGSYRKVPDF
ncbi:MAG: DJ-1/PfpI family protein [Candidatus Omnitrophica bacterium]|nr:DJ-1/PfpI family protein [Candidatus Omnitrophota bacterium]